MCVGWCVVCGVWWVWVCEGVPLYTFYCQFKLLFCVKHWKVQDFFVDVRGHSLHGLNRSEKGLPLLRTGPLLELLHHHSCLLLSRQQLSGLSVEHLRQTQGKGLVYTLVC